MFNLKKIKSLIPYFLLAVAVIIVYKAINELNVLIGFVKQFFAIITPFFYGFILAYILNMPFDAIQKLIGKCKLKFISKRKKAFSLLIVFLLIALIIFSVSYLVVPVVSRSIQLFINNLPSYYKNTLSFIENINSWGLFDFEIDFSVSGFTNMLQGLLQNLSFEYLSSSMNALFGFSSAIFGVGSAIFSGFLTFISSVYFLLEKDKIKDFICKMLLILSANQKTYNTILKYSGRLDKNVKQYIKTQTIDGCILGTIATIELLIMRSPFALVLGIMLGIINYIPYFGSIFGTIIAVVIVAFTQGFPVAAIAAAVLLITQQIDGNIIQPKLMGGSFSLSPLLVIISITVGGAAAGILGMIIAIPIVAVLKDVLEDIIAYYGRRKLRKMDILENLSKSEETEEDYEDYVTEKIEEDDE